MRSLCSRLAAAELPLLCLIAPTLLFPRGLLPLAGLAAILALWVARWVARRRVTLPTPLDLPMMILLAMSLVALYPSADLALSMPKLYGIVLGVAAYYAVVNGVDSLRSWWIVAAGLMLAAVGVAALGLVSASWIATKLVGSGALYSRIPRLVPSVESSFGPIAGIHPNELGGTLAFLLPLPLALLLWLRRGDAGTRGTKQDVQDGQDEEMLGTARSSSDSPEETPTSMFSREPHPAYPVHPVSFSPRLLATVALATLLLAGPVLLLTYSRSGLVGFGCAALLLVGLRWRRAGCALALLSLLGAVALAWEGPRQIAEWAITVDRLSSGLAVVEDRLELWNRAASMIRDFPYTGIGLNTFPKVLNVLYPLFRSPYATIPHAHNIYLQVGVDLGLAGLMAFVGLVLMVGWQAVLAYRRTRGLARGAVAGLAAGGLAYLVYGLADAITLGAKPLVLLWVAMGLVVVANRLPAAGELLQGDAAPAENTPTRWMRRAGRTLWALYWMVAVLLAGTGFLVVAISMAG